MSASGHGNEHSNFFISRTRTSLHYACPKSDTDTDTPNFLFDGHGHSFYFHIADTDTVILRTFPTYITFTTFTTWVASTCWRYWVALLGGVVVWLLCGYCVALLGGATICWYFVVLLSRATWWRHAQGDHWVAIMFVRDANWCPLGGVTCMVTIGWRYPASL